MLLLVAALTATSPAAFPEPPKSRAEALTALKNTDAAARAEAVVWIANRGAMADAPLLHERLRDESLLVREYAERGLWLLWTRSGDADIDQRMGLATDLMQDGRYAEAIAVLSDVVRKKPAYAEGWNRRATVYFLAGEYRKSIADCDEVFKRNPGHFGALAGMGEIHLALGEPAEALKWFRRALEVNPNMLGVEMSIRQIEERLKERKGTAT
jgi:tetratricopeptide (TPR) repeat protein